MNIYTALAIVAVVASALCAILHVAGLGYIFSPLTSLLAACAALLTGMNGLNILLAAGLVSSVIGDWYLVHQNGSDKRFISGVVFFFIAHCLFALRSMTRFSFDLKALVVAVILIVLLSFYYLFRLVRSLSDNIKVPIILYILISIASLYFALSASTVKSAHLVCALGIALILFSDLMIAESKFMRRASAEKLVLPTYYACHVCLAVSALLCF